MQQRVNLARALLVRPNILLMDEPFSALDPTTKNRLQRDLLELWEDFQFTVVMVSHSLEDVVALSDRVAVFTDKPVSDVKTVAIDLRRPRGNDVNAKLEMLLEIERLETLG